MGGEGEDEEGGEVFWEQYWWVWGGWTASRTGGGEEWEDADFESFWRVRSITTIAGALEVAAAGFKIRAGVSGCFDLVGRKKSRRRIWVMLRHGRMSTSCVNKGSAGSSRELG